MTDEKPKGKPLADANWLHAVGGVLVFFGFVPAFAGGQVNVLFLLLGVLLLIGGAIVHAIKSRP